MTDLYRPEPIILTEAELKLWTGLVQEGVRPSVSCFYCQTSFQPKLNGEPAPCPVCGVLHRVIVRN